MDIKVTKPDSPVNISLKLSSQEAAGLRTLMRNVGGNYNGPRGVARALNEALQDAGVGYYEGVTEGAVYIHKAWDDMPDVCYDRGD